MRGIEKGRYSVEAYNKNFCLLSAVKKKGKNDQLLTEVKLQEKTALASHGFKHVGVDTYIDHHGPVRYWDGKGDGTPANIFYRQWVTLPAGKHEMIVRFKLGSLNPKSPYENNGLIQIYKAASDDLINQTELRLSEEKGFTQQTLSFELKDSQRVEFRLLAGNLALYLDSYSYKIGN